MRVLGSAALLLVVALAAGIVVQRAVLLRRLHQDVDRSLTQERQELEVLASGVNPTTGQPFAGDVAAIFDTFLARNVPGTGEAFFTFVDDRPYRASPAPLALHEVPEVAARWTDLRAGERGRLRTSVGDVRYLAVPVERAGEVAGVFVVANFLQDRRDEIDAAIRVEAVVALGVLVVTTAMAWGVAGRLLRPVRQLTDTARSIGDRDLTRRIPVEGEDEIAELARTFNAMLDRLQASFATQRAFVDDAGHELRTPITVIRGHLELMGDDPDERRDTLALVTDELDRMARIVDDLLLLAKAEQPDFVQPRPTELTDFTTELFAKARALGARAWVLDEAAEGEVALDDQRLTQAVLNLARNSVEHTGPDDTVALGSRLADGELRLWVRDTGPGIHPDEHARIFERFARGRAERRHSEGAGLGLAIVRAVAEAHEGYVELDSRPGEGATFTLVLPAPATTDAPGTPSGTGTEHEEEPSPTWPGS